MKKRIEIYFLLWSYYWMIKILKIYVLKVFYFEKFWKCAKNIMKYANFFVFVLYCTKRRCSEIKPQLKDEIEDGREAS